MSFSVYSFMRSNSYPYLYGVGFRGGTNYYYIDGRDLNTVVQASVVDPSEKVKVIDSGPVYPNDSSTLYRIGIEVANDAAIGSYDMTFADAAYLAGQPDGMQVTRTEFFHVMDYPAEPPVEPDSGSRMWMLLPIGGVVALLALGAKRGRR
jgi:hypothetical protein